MPEPNETPDAAPKKKKRIARGREIKQKRTKLLQVEGGEDPIYYRVRRGIDFSLMVVQGIIPTPMMQAVQRMSEMRDTWANKGPLAALEGLTEDDKRSFLDMIRKCAVMTIITPRVTDSKKAAQLDPDLLWVGGYSDLPGEGDRPEPGDVPDTHLIRVYQYTTGEAGLVVMEDDEADDFRTDESSADGATRAHGADVRTEAVVVASAEDHVAVPEIDSPPTIEFVGHG